MFLSSARPKEQNNQLELWAFCLSFVPASFSQAMSIEDGDEIATMKRKLYVNEWIGAVGRFGVNGNVSKRLGIGGLAGGTGSGWQFGREIASDRVSEIT